VAVERPLPDVMAHPPTLTQAATNLLSNAIKFVPTGLTPRVNIRAEERGGQVRLWVEDNGIGIDPAHQERVFQPFQRLHGVETYPGTGIGLAIVRRSVERMGGHSGVISGPEEGSRFWIELRAARKEKAE
jgi:signal transduction histidine kinase